MSETGHNPATIIQKVDNFAGVNWKVDRPAAGSIQPNRIDVRYIDGVPLGKDGGLTESEILEILGWPV